jgi:photosystem II stability/assembly factor-like uncharacterized protein
MQNLVRVLSFFFLITQAGLSQWYLQNSGTTNSLRGIYFTGQITGFAAGGFGTILKTVDGGINWIPQNSGTFNKEYL